jgi:hypothetical protein
MGWVSIRIAVAAHWAGSKDSRQWLRAAQIEPANASYWDQLGLFEEWDFEHGDLQQSIRYFRRAVQLNPHSDLYWMDLAGAYEVSGQPDEARRAYLQALAAHPDSADVAWRYGSFLLRQGDAGAAASQVRRALVAEPELVPSAVSQFSKSGAGIDFILGQVVPARVPDYLALVHYFAGQQDEDSAVATWAKLASLHPHFPITDALDFIDGLIERRRIEDAERVWREALEAAGISSQPDNPGSLMFNGGFERDFLGGGFDWRVFPADGAVLDIVSDVVHAGRRSARVTFDGTANVDYRNLLQYVPVSPGRSYHFIAYMRTDAISGDSGLGFVIADCAEPDKPVAQTESLTDTHPWTQLEADFTASPVMRCVIVVLRRPPSLMMFANKFRGTVWVDDAQLVPAPGGEPSKR